jgi:hypothetical protein
VVGFTLPAAGAAMLLLSAPGIVKIAIGLAILSAEFVWARRWLERKNRHAGTHSCGVAHVALESMWNEVEPDPIRSVNSSPGSPGRWT